MTVTGQQQRVYFIRAKKSGMVKIGVALDPAERLRDLQTAAHEPLELLATIEGGRELEQRLHRTFAASRSSGEWFHPTAELTAAILSARQRRFDPDHPKNAMERIRRRKREAERRRRALMVDAIQRAADRAGMTPHDWVWNVAMPKIAELALADEESIRPDA